MATERKAHLIYFDLDDSQFMEEYVNGKNIKSIQEFVRDAVKKKIFDIEVIEQLRNFEQIKK